MWLTSSAGAAGDLLWHGGMLDSSDTLGEGHIKLPCSLEIGSRNEWPLHGREILDQQNRRCQSGVGGHTFINNWHSPTMRPAHRCPPPLASLAFLPVGSSCSISVHGLLQLVDGKSLIRGQT